MTQQEFQTRYKYNPSTDCIGEGGFGKVYKAYDTHLDKWVAIKVAEVKPGLEQVRLKKEVEIVSKLPTHPNIANYEACYTFSSFTGDYDFAVLQYYEEGNLQQLIDSGKLNQTQKETLLRQILEGVGFLHNQEIIHRDLKPQNILIAKRNDEYIPKITDFGISKKLDINKSSVFTNSLAGAGTMAYASPEQLLGKTIKKNTDLWSFGVIVCQVFTGKLPFSVGRNGINSEAGRIEHYKQIVNGTISFSDNSIPAKWQQLIKQCIVVDNNLRAANDILLKNILTVQFSCGTELYNNKLLIDCVNGIKFEMIFVEGGTFNMGSSISEKDRENIESQHKVSLNSFYIGKTPVTQALWKAVMGSNPSWIKGDNLPVETVDWSDCQDFIAKLNNLTMKKYNFPTEAQWEFAARGGVLSKKYIYSGSNCLDEVAWYKDNSNGELQPVATKLPNELGIFDMSGNINEWCLDWVDFDEVSDEDSYYYSEKDYSKNNQINPKGTTTGIEHVNRGGSYSDFPEECRCASRSKSILNTGFFGLRLTLNY